MEHTEALYLTTPIFYANDVPHIGHAYTEVAADSIARWSRQRGVATHLLAGTDEHGEKIMRTAVANAVTPKEWVDRLVETSWKPLLQLLEVEADDFIRTTDERHVRAVQAFLAQLHDDGYIYEGVYEGYYCVGCEEYKQVGDYEQRGDEYYCLIHARPLEYLRETNYFFKLSAFSETLAAHYEANPGALEPDSVRHEILAFLSSGVRDISITRSSFDWGIQVPWDEQHVVYVWFDALINYISAVGWQQQPETFAKWWPAVHLVGKDIARLHAVLWPAMLLAAGLPLPRKIFGHGWLLVNGEKMSKTRRTGIAPGEIIDIFGADAFRYYFLSTIRFGQDGSYSWEDMGARYNAELANGLGNLASRLIAMIERYSGGRLRMAATLGSAAPEWQETLRESVSRFDEAMERLQLHDAIAEARALVDGLNQFLTTKKPWEIARDSSRQDELVSVLTEALAVLSAIACLLQPFMPSAMAALWAQLGLQDELGRVESIDPNALLDVLEVGTVEVTRGLPLFPRVELESKLEMAREVKVADA